MAPRRPSQKRQSESHLSKAELRRLDKSTSRKKSTSTLQEHPAPIQPKEFHRFLDLPAELRNVVYEYSMLDFVPRSTNPEHSSDTKVSEPAIMRASQLLRRETSSHYCNRLKRDAISASMETATAREAADHTLHRAQDPAVDRDAGEAILARLDFESDYARAKHLSARQKTAGARTQLRCMFDSGYSAGHCTEEQHKLIKKLLHLGSLCFCRRQRMREKKRAWALTRN